jgi:hypothetical protein
MVGNHPGTDLYRESAWCCGRGAFHAAKSSSASPSAKMLR